MLMGNIQSQKKMFLLGTLVLLLLFINSERFKFNDSKETRNDTGSRKIMEIEEKDKISSCDNNDMLNVKY